LTYYSGGTTLYCSLFRDQYLGVRPTQDMQCSYLPLAQPQICCKCNENDKYSRLLAAQVKSYLWAGRLMFHRWTQRHFNSDEWSVDLAVEPVRYVLRITHRATRFLKKTPTDLAKFKHAM